MSSVGITATRHGLTDVQKRYLRNFLAVQFTWLERDTFRHGDCVGGDEEGAAIAAELGFLLVAHPPTDERLRAFARSDIVLPPLPYLARNRAIVDASAWLVACPDGPERVRSGTWSTYRYARRIGTPTLIIFPDGAVE